MVDLQAENGAMPASVQALIHSFNTNMTNVRGSLKDFALDIHSQMQDLKANIADLKQQLV